MNFNAGSMRLPLVALTLWAVVTCFYQLGRAPVPTVNEAREGVYVRAMLDAGDFILPVVPNHVENGEIVPDKPPLFHWLAVGATVVRAVVSTGTIPDGQVLSRQFDEWSHRFPSACCGVLTVIAVATLGRRLVGERAAWLAAAGLLLSWQFVHDSRYGRVDMTLACFVTLAMLCSAKALLDGESKRVLVVAGAASGFAVLAKGPLGVVLPLVACGIYAILKTASRRSARWLFGLPWVWAGLLCALVALPWYLAAYAEGGMAFVNSQLLGENVQQFTGANGRMRTFYYVIPFLGYSFPWSLMGVAGLWLAWRTRHPGAVFCAVWWIAFLVFFQISAYKRSAYLLPVLPAGCLLAGFWLDSRLPPPSELTRARVFAGLSAWWKPAAILTLAAATAGAIIIQRQLCSLPFCLAWLPRDGAMVMAGIVLVLLATAMLVVQWRKHDAWRAVVALCAALAAFYIGIVPPIAVTAAESLSSKPLANRIARDLPAGHSVTVRGLGDDPSMLVLLYFAEPKRMIVVPEKAPTPPVWAPGYYLLSQREWDAIQSAGTEAPNRWRVLWSDEFRQDNGGIPVYFVERRS